MKNQMIADFKKQIESVLAQVREATGNFREIEQLDAVQPLPPPVSTNVTLLANQMGEFRLKLGYETTMYEHLSEIETATALVLVDEMTRDLAAKNAPAARKKLSDFMKRSSEPNDGNRKPLRRYLTSALSLCDRSKTEAEAHLQKARSFGSAGKKSEALREYQEISRIYPNPVTAERIRQLEGESR